MPRRRAPSEHEWIRRLVARLPSDRRLQVGPGDDAAALRVGGRSLLVTTDALVEGVHFRRGWLSPRALGARAYAVNASDVAAMGGRPLAAVMALEVPADVDVGTLDAVVAGFVAAARRHAAMLVGGNLARGPALAVTVTLLGLAGRRIVTRGGARPGDVVLVTGRLGETATAVRDLRGGRRRRLPRVPDRVADGARLARLASAMIDVSDGLVQDLGHVARASRVAIRVEEERVPVAPRCRARLGAAATAFALAGGEDYELACAVPAGRVAAARRAAAALGCPLTPVGVVARGEPDVRVLDAAGRPVPLRRAGFDHLAGPARRR